MLTRKLKVKILEVNHAPSFNSDTPYDFKMKSELFRNMFEVIQCNLATRNKILETTKRVFEEKFKNGVVKTVPQAKEALKESFLKEQDTKVARVLGAFEQIYPVEDPQEPYEEFMRFAEERETRRIQGSGQQTQKERCAFQNEDQK